jgi:hypothetical protein
MKALKGFLLFSFYFFSTSLWGQNSSLSFNGSNQSVSIPSTIYSNGVQNFTIECWVKPSSAAATGTAYHGFIGYQGGSSSTASRNPSIWLYGGEIHTDMYDHVNSTRYDVLTTTLDLATEKWFHVAFVKSGTTQYLYINGNLVNTATAPTGAKISGNYLIGAVDNFIDGDLDEVRFWSTARTQTEIREYMQRAPRMNETGLIAYYPFNEGTGSTLANVCTNTSNINGTLNNSPTWTTGSTGLTGYNSLILDGTNDFLDGTLNTTSSTSYTIEFWFTPKKLNVQQNMVYIRDDATTNTNLARTVVFVNSSNQLAFYVANSSGTANTLTHTNFTVALNTWYHVACTFNNGAVSMVTTGHSIVPTGSSFPTFNFDGTDYLAVGADYSGVGANIFSNIVIDELRIWSTARTTAEVTANRSKYLDLTTSGLIAYYDFNQGIGGGTNTDLSLIYDKKAGSHLRINNMTMSSTSSNLITQDTIVVTRANWYGETNSIWSTASNWSERVAAPKGAHVFLSSSTVNNPAMASNMFLRGVDIATGKSLSLNSYYLKVDHGFTGTGTITGSTSSILEFNGRIDNTFYMNQTTSGTTNALKQLIITTGGASVISPGNTLIITELLNVPYGSYNGNGNTILRSTSTKTAIALISDDASTSGNFTVETYFPARRAFRLFSSPINSTSTIYGNWQEGGTNTSGLGTHITGNGTNGTDATTSGNASLFTYSNTGKSWSAVTSTNNSSTDKITAGTPYRIMVRGDRSTDLTTSTATASNTVLRTTGTLNVTSQTVTMPSNTAANTDVFIGNPFQAALDMGSILGSTSFNTNFKSNVMYIWDPKLGTRGAYTTVSLPGGSSTGGSAANQYLMPGQAAFLKTNNSGAASVNLSRYRTYAQDRTNTFLEFPDYSELKVNLYYRDSFLSNGSACDGIMVLFSGDNSSAYDPEDANKPANLDEMFGIADASNNLYSLDRRNFPTGVDTIQLSLSKTRDNRYTYSFQPLNVSGFEIYLRDAIKDQIHPISNINQTTIDFEVIEPADEKRFQLIFSPERSPVLDLNVNNTGVYPNPTTGTIYVNGNLQNVRIFNSLGQEISIEFAETQNGLKIIKMPSNTPSGIYILQSTGGTKKIQLIK